MVHHGDGHLLQLTKDRKLVEQLKIDYTQANLSLKDQVMLDYAAKLTREPWAMRPSDIDRLRSVGFTDRDILDLAMVVGYFAFANRLCDGLGVAVEDFFIQNVLGGDEKR